MFIESFDKHYYDEDNIEVGKQINAHMVVNSYYQKLLIKEAYVIRIPNTMTELSIL